MRNRRNSRNSKTRVSKDFLNKKQLAYTLTTFIVAIIVAFISGNLPNSTNNINVNNTTNIINGTDNILNEDISNLNNSTNNSDVNTIISFSSNNTNQISIANESYKTLNDVPEYSGNICVKINGNKPYFTDSDYTTSIFEKYSELDSLGRSGVAFANVCKEIMPQDGEERRDISSIKPTGWHQIKINDEYLYNRCHLIAHSLSNENANKQNLITGTKYFNVQGMLPIEEQVLNYMHQNENNHVLYRVTPIFKGKNLVASGVEMEGYSVEDNGSGICFNVFVYNVQPGVNINYMTGEVNK